MFYMLNSYFSNFIHPIPDVTIESFFEILETPIITDNRDNEWLFNFYELQEELEMTDDDKIHKVADNIKSFECLMLDYDVGQFSIKEAKEKFAKYKHYGYSSYNHKYNKKENKPSDVEKFRICLPLRKRIPAEKIRDNRKALLDLYPGIDQTSLSIARFFYPPVIHPDRQDDYEYWYNDGELYMPPIKLKKKEIYKSKKTLQPKNENIIMQKLRNYYLQVKKLSAEEELNDLDFSVRGTGIIHNELLRIHAKLYHQGLDPEEILEIMLPFAIDASSYKEIEHIVNNNNLNRGD